MNRFLLSVIIVLSAFTAKAQNNKEYFNIEGVIQVENGTPTNVKVNVSRVGKGKKETVIPKPDGKYIYELDFQGEYTFEFSLDGYLTKTIRVNTTVPKEVLEDGIMPFFMDVFMYKDFNGSKNEPITVSFNDREYGFRYDKPYMQTLKAQKLTVEQLKAGNDLELQANYDAAIKKADGLFSSKDYKNAKDAYQEALKLKSSETYPKTRMAEIDKILSELALKEQQEKDLQAKYDAAVDKGDAAYNSGDYTAAKDAFTEANTLKPKEQYPISKLTEINRILDELAMKDANQKALNDKYNAAIKKGDDAFARQDYTTAKQGYNEALGLKPTEKYPADKLDEINRILGDLALKEQQQKELNNKYDAAIKNGDLSFSKKDYTTARQFYVEAQTLKTGVTYPSERIQEIDRILGDLALKDQQQKELQDKYDAAIIKGDNAFKTNDYTAARDAYTEASTLKPAEQYPKDKLAEIKKILDALALKDANEKALNEKYDAAIRKGDDAFAKQDYTTAKQGYTDALGLKPTEKYPQDKLDEINRILGDLALKDQQEKDLKANYDAAVKKGDNALNSKDYANAKSFYQQALTLKPDETYPKTKIEEIDRTLGDLALKQQQEKELQEKYDAAIVKGDNAFNSGDYPAAKDAFTEASGYKPTEQYPKTKLSEIQKILGDLALKDQQEKDLKARYDAAIKKGDDAFAKQDYKTARTGYNEAVMLKSTEQYPKDKLAEVERILTELAQKEADQKALNDKYAAFIKQGDAALAGKKYDEAKTAYNDALGIKPTEQYPKDKLAEIEKALNELALKEQQQKELNTKYDAAIGRGDAAFNSGDYTAAKDAYQEASGLKPAEKYPKDKIAEINRLLAEIAQKEANEKALNDKYDAAIKKGDDLLAAKDYTNARLSYNQALTLKSGEAYPKTKIEEIDRILAEIAQKEAAQKELDTKYTTAIKSADDALKRKEYENAKNLYNDALTLKPGEQYPKDKIAEIEKTQAEIALKEKQDRELKEKYDAAILNGDNAFNNSDYAGARKYFEEAQSLKPAEKYPKDKIAQIDKLLAEIALKEKQERELKEKYDAAIRKGDTALAEKKYTDARTAYTEASGLKPGEQYPKDKIKEIDDTLAEIARLEAIEKEKKEKYDAAVKKGDELFAKQELTDAKTAYQEALTYKPEEVYPQDQIKEIDRLEEERKKREEEARIQAELERLRKLNNVTVIEDETARQDALKKGERQALGGGGYVVLKPYGSIEALGSKYFGYINFGGGANIEITKEEFDKYKVMFNK